MPDSTANRGYPYPTDTDLIDVAGDIQALAEALDVDTRGLLKRNIKSTTQGGYGQPEYAISGLEFTVPATPTGRIHQVTFGIRMITDSTNPPSNGSVVYVTLRQGSVTGALVGSLNFPFNATDVSQYGYDRIGGFIPTGMVPGATYVVTTGSNSGLYSVAAGSWSSLWDIGP